MAVIEYSRNQIGLVNANSTEMDPNCKDAVIDLMESQKSVIKKGGTMRLGAWNCELTNDSKAAHAYQSKIISERHRHRYEVNIAYRDQLEAGGMVISGLSPDGSLPEIVERADHPFFVAVQFHPELKSKPFDPHPLFTGFVAASMEKSRLV